VGFCPEHHIVIKEKSLFMNSNQIEKILGNVKMSMEMEGFIVDSALEEVGRKILMGSFPPKITLHK